MASSTKLVCVLMRSKLKPVFINSRNKNAIYRSISSKLKVEFDPQVLQGLEEKRYKARHHPGIMNLKCVVLPPQLEHSILTMLTTWSLKDIKKQSTNLVRYLSERKQPVDNQQLRELSREMSVNLDSERGNMELLTAEEQELEKQRRKDIVAATLKKSVYHWEPIEYNAYTSMLYLVGRIAPNFAVLQRVFNEIIKRDSEFKPRTIFDFGSGVGTTVWAARALWGASLKEYFCVDTSVEMNTLARVLLQGGKEGLEMSVKGVFFRQFLPVSNTLKYDVVVSAFSLLELPSFELRLQTIDILWQKTLEYLIIIENGNNEGYKTVLEARDFILQQSRKTSNGGEFTDVGDGHVFAPCSHDKDCPRLMDGSNTPCNFEVDYFPLKLAKDLEAATERFSYVILKRGARTSDHCWPRIVRPVLPRGKHVVCRLCTSAGKLEEVIFTKAKHAKDVYTCARASQWGNFLPLTRITLQTQKEVEEEKLVRRKKQEKCKEAT